jgi:putative ABC transport system permease protein
MDTLLQDIRYAVRTLLRSPGFTLVAALTLALGIGANTAIFSVIDAALLRSLPYADPDRLVQVWEDAAQRGINNFPFSPGDFADLRTQTRSLRGVAAIQRSSFNLTGSGEPVRVGAARVSASFFDVLGRRPVLGRGFAPGEESQGADHVAVIGQGLWKERFGGDAKVVGRTVLLDGERYTIVGVAAAGVGIPRNVQMWVPWALTAQDLANHGGHYAQVIGRLAPGATLEQAQQELKAIGARVESQHPDTNTGFGMHPVPLHDELVREVRPALLVLFAAVGLLLLIACANVSNLLLARAASRSREIAVRAALGAGRWRLVRQLLVESMVLGLLGGAAGLLLAAWGVGLIVRAAGDALRLPTAVSMDGGVLAFTFAVAVLTGVLFGLIPALHASRLDLHETLKEGGRSGSGDARRARSRAVLVVAETALAMVLLVGAGLLVKSFATLAGTDPGFRVEHVLTGSIDLPRVAYGTPERQAGFFRALDERAAAIPGVRSAGAATTLPLSGATSRIGFHVVGTPPDRPGEGDATGYDVVTPGYFDAIGIPLKRGRTFGARDDARAPGAVVINEAMGRRYFGGQDPVGRRITLTDQDTSAREIVGVVGDVRHEGLGEEPSPAVYVSQLQAPVPFMRYVVRTAGDPARAAAALRREVAALDGRVAVGEVRTMAEVVADSVASPRLSMVLLGIFAALGIALAAIGLYGVVSYSVASRSQEIGIRMAMGARPGDVIRMVVRQGMGMTAGGLVLGLAGAFAATRLLRTMLVGVSSTDPAVFALVPLLLASVALAATWLPGRHATRLDPMAALRKE